MAARRENRAAHRITLLCLLGFVASGAPAQVELFEPGVANTRLEGLQSDLDSGIAADVDLEALRREAFAVLERAEECVEEMQPLVQELESERAVLEEITDEVDVEIFDRRVEIGNAYAQADARLKTCELVVVRAERLVDGITGRMGEITTQQMSLRTGNLLDVLRGAPSEVRGWPDRFFNALATPVKEDFSRIGALLLVLFATLSAATASAYASKRFHGSPVAQGKTAVTAETTVFLLAPLFDQLPWIIAALVATLAAGFVVEPPVSAHLLVRLPQALLAFFVMRVLVQWSLTPLSPAHRIEELVPDNGPALARRAMALTGALLASYVALGTEYLGEEMQEGLPLLRLTSVVAVTITYVMLLGIATRVRGMRGRFRTFRLVGFLGMTGALFAELIGFQNFADFLLRAIVLTTAAAYILWLALWASAAATHWLDKSPTPTARQLRTLLGISGEARQPGLGIYQLVVDSILWAAFLLVLIRLWDTSRTWLDQLASYAIQGIPIGNITIVPADIFAGVAVFAALIVVTGWVKRWIDRRWLGRITQDRGTRDALITVVGYIGFILATIIGLSLTGIPLTGLALVAGALSVGIGFGLQAIANNFVSGIILLFERPIRPGDFVTVGDTEGFVKRINIRATEIETLDNQDLLVPNSELISGRVTNWVLHNPYGRLQIEVGVAYGSDTERVKEILESVARDHAEVITDGRAPGPKALFLEFGDSSLNFELRVRIFRIPRRYDVVSDLNFAIEKALREAGIEIPFPQRDLHVRSWSPGAIPDAPDSTESPAAEAEPDNDQAP